MATSSDGDNKNSVRYIIDNSPMDSKTKLQIKLLGRPLPDLKLTMACIKKKGGRSYMRHFSRTSYDRYKWACGCDVLHAFFCFPCLLFYTEGNNDKTWSRTGVTDLNHLHEAMNTHELTIGHKQACTQFAFLGKVDIKLQLSAGYRQQMADHNAKVTKNRHILRRIINCVKFCGASELAFDGNDQRNGGTCKELSDYCVGIDSVLKEHLATSVFITDSKEIEHDILDCMLAVCRIDISSQAKSAEFLSIQCNDISDVNSHYQMALILRYVDGYSVCERFWCFIQTAEKSYQAITKHIQAQIDPLIIVSQKLISQSYEWLNSVKEVEKAMREKYPLAYFVHSYAHQLDRIIYNAACQNPQIKVFFSDLSGFPAFFSNSSHISNIVDGIFKARLPNIPQSLRNSNLRIIVDVVHENRENLISTFQEIAMNVGNPATAREANNLRRTLEDSNFIIWLTLFHGIFPQAEKLYNEFHSDEIKHLYIQSAVSDFESSLSVIRLNAGIKEECEPETTAKRGRLDVVEYTELCDVIVAQMKHRFSRKGYLYANYLFQSNSYVQFNSRFPLAIVTTVLDMYPMLIRPRLITELKVIYARNDFVQIKGAGAMLELILKNDLQRTFPEVTKLLKIVVTTPVVTNESDRCFSTTERIKTLLRLSTTNDRLTALAMLAVNKDFVMELVNFEEKVFQKFVALKHRRMDFTFKN